MTDFWQSLLEQSSLNQHVDFDGSDYLIPLSQLGILEIKGDDSTSFLQNLLTNDVDALSINQSQLNGFCNAKGRLFAIFLLIRRAGSFQLVLPRTMCVGLQQRLTMYKLRSKVVISENSDDLSLLGLVSNTENTIANINLPTQDYQVSENENALFIKLPGLIDRYLCLDHQPEIERFCQQLIEQQWHVASETTWQVMDINAGLATVLPETKEKFTPQQLNFDLIGGVSFNKGCYPGQEVVARLHYLGNPSRRLFSAHCREKVQPEVGDEITDHDGNILGHIVTAQFNAIDTIKLLLSLKLADSDKDMFVNTSTEIVGIQSLATD